MFGAASAMIAVALFAGSDSTADAHFQRAAELAGRGERHAAEQEYVAGLHISPQSAAFNNLGVLYFEESDFSKAATAFASARKLQPNDPEIAFNLGLALYKTGDTHAAIPHLVAAATSSHALDVHYLLGACYYSQKQWDKSIAELERFRAQISDKPEALFILVHAYRYAQNPAASLDAAAHLLKSSPDSPFTHEILGEAYDKDGQPAKAIEEFQKAINASPLSPELHFMLGYVCWRWKRYDEAIGPLRQETRINPGYAAAYYYLGDIAFRQRNTAEALRYLQAALRLDPSYGEAYLDLGKLHFEAGRIEDAVAALQKAKPSLDDSTEVHLWLGRALIRAGREDEGRKELARVAQLNDTEHRKMQDLFNGVPVGERQQAPPR
jgi:tetratricopeptide (TPR) repeat protein